MNLDQSQKHILLNTSDGNDGNLANWRYKILENSIISFVNSIFDLDWILLLIFIYKKDTLQMINFLIQLVNNTKSFAIIQKINLIK